MKEINECTVVDILNSYKKIISKDIEKVASIVFLSSNNKRTLFEKEIDNIMKERGFDKKNDVYFKAREEIVYKEIVNNFLMNIELNNDNKVKLALLSEIYKRFSKDMTERDRKEIKTAILGEINSYAIYKYDSEKYEGIKEYEIITKEREEKVKSIHDDVLRDCIQESIEQAVDFENIQSVMKEGYSEQIYNTIMQKLLINFFLDGKRMSVKEFKKNLDNNNFNDIFLKDSKLEKEFEKLLVDYFSNNLQYIDKNLLLLNSGAIAILGIQMMQGREVDELKLGDIDFDNEKSRIMEENIDFIREIYNEISKRKYEDLEYSITSEDGKNIITVSKEYISEFLSRCTKNDYVSDEEIERIHNALLEGSLEEDIDKRRIADLNTEDVIAVNGAYEAKENNNESKEKIKKGILDLINYLKDEDKLSDEELIDMYLNGKINIELINDINMPEFSEEYYSDKFKQLYNETVFSSEDEREIKNQKLQRMSDFYIRLENTGKVNIDRDELIEYFINLYGHDFATTILDELNELNIVEVKKAIEWVGTDILSRKYEKGKLKPAEVRNFYEEGIINLDGIANIVNRLDNNGERFMLIGSIFPEETEEDRETRDLLIDECLKIDSEIENSKVGNKRKYVYNKPPDYYKHITDPFARMSLIKAFDEDYSFEMTSDGHAIVRLPNLKSVVIEKMLDKNKEPSYGVATCILDEEYYEENNFRIKKDGKIDRQEMSKDADSKQVKKFSHFINSWGINIKNYFLDEKKANWSKEKSDKIDEAIERVKRSDKNLLNICSEQQLAKMILNLMVTKKATLEQIERIADIYGVDLGKVMDSLDER